MFPGGITQHSQAIVRNHRRGLADDEDPRMRANHESLRGCSAAIECCLAHLRKTPQGPCACQELRLARTRRTGGRVSVSPSARSVRPAAGYEIRCAWCGDVMRLTTNVFYKFFLEDVEEVGGCLRSALPQDTGVLIVNVELQRSNFYFAYF
jgi:hypothetical protein